MQWLNQFLNKWRQALVARREPRLDRKLLEPAIGVRVLEERRVLSAPQSIAVTPSEVAENTDTSSNVLIGTLTVTQDDDGLDDPFAPYSYSLVGNQQDNELFEIQGDQLFLKSGTTLDYEADDLLRVRVEVNDDGATSRHTLDINLTDVNESPTDISLSNNDVDENDAGASIGNVTVADPDDSGTPFGQHVLSVDDARFEIVSGELRLKAGELLDHEAGETIALNITADDGDNSFTLPFVINVADVNESPTAILLDNASVDEDADGAVVGAISVTDPDDPGEPFGQHTFAVDDNRFEIVGGDLKLKSGESLDHENEGTVTLTLTADDGDNEFMQEWVITVNDVNEAPTAIALDNDTVDENLDGAIVGRA